MAGGADGLQFEEGEGMSFFCKQILANDKAHFSEVSDSERRIK